MKNRFLLSFLFIASFSFAQNTQPLYLIFDSSVSYNWKYDIEQKEDTYYFSGRFVGGFPLELITYNKRDYVEINQSELSNYNVKNIEEIKQMMATKTEIEQLDFWGQLHEQKKLYVIEILPNNKAKIVKVWVAPH